MGFAGRWNSAFVSHRTHSVLIVPSLANVSIASQPVSFPAQSTSSSACFLADPSVRRRSLLRRRSADGSFKKPGKGVFADFIVFRVSGFDVSLIQDVEPRYILMLIAGPNLSESLISFFGEAAQVPQIVGCGAVAC